MVFLDNLEDIAIGVAKEEPGERRFPDRLDQRRPMSLQSFLQPGEFGEREGDGDMPAEFLLERRRLELRDPRSDAARSPVRFPARRPLMLILPGRATGCQPSDSRKKATDRRHIAGRQGNVRQCHAFGPRGSRVVNSSGDPR